MDWIRNSPQNSGLEKFLFFQSGKILDVLDPHAPPASRNPASGLKTD